MIEGKEDTYGLTHLTRFCWKNEYHTDSITQYHYHPCAVTIGNMYNHVGYDQLGYMGFCAYFRQTVAKTITQINLGVCGCTLVYNFLRVLP